MSKISPFLLLIGKAEEAVKFYTSVFRNAKIQTTMSGPDGSILGFSFQLEDLEFTALNVGPEYAFNPGISFFVRCENQAEVDDLWTKLTSNGGKESMCGWLEDKYGISWQIIPNTLMTLMQDPDREKAGRVMQAMMQMRKINVQALEDAYNGK